VRTSSQVYRCDYEFFVEIFFTILPLLSSLAMTPETSLSWIQSWKCSDVISQIEVSYDESIVGIATFSTEANSTVYLVSASNGQILHKLHHNFPIADMKFCPRDSSILVTVSDHIRVFKWGNLSAVLNPHNEQDIVEVCPFTAIDFESTKGSLFAVTDVRGFCSVWDLNATDDQPIKIYELVSEILYSVSFVTENVIGVVSESGSMFVIDRRTHSAVGTEAQDECVPACQPRLLAWNHQSSMIAIANQTSGTFAVYELKSIRDNPKFLGSSPRVTKPGSGIACMKWVESQSGAQVLVIARDSGTVEVWNTNYSRLDAPVFQISSETSASALSYYWKNCAVLVGLTNGRMSSTKLPEIASTRTTRKSFTGKFDDYLETTNYPALG